MKTHRLVTLTAAVLLSASLLAPTVRAADADGVMMHDWQNDDDEGRSSDDSDGELDDYVQRRHGHE